MVSIEISGPLLLAAAVLGAAWIYRDAKRRAMDTADMWAVGFFVAFVLLPVLGGLAVFVFYLRNRNRRRGSPVAVPGA
ncbi:MULTISPECIES: hypothetical protein [Haloferax]|uniref:Cardiolipin synthase N-terminal domain-containing protein n=1 Tax=Haloferax gibbonsii TaxID=35746 RepID=A0A0K1IQC9_HALGI|nr:MULTISPECIES: hypothetical protein [Haloferax]AKU06676.1 hypothetical protein ABY42_02560 [Haloferax gibbonsii]QOS10670.1 uncharacterized protein HfgLR_02585 [Haloferax gibbonsii]RDZ54513.1 hypothetical protein C5C07_03005 [Haloferax sp. Atlit-4N]